MTSGLQSAVRIGLIGSLVAWHVSLVGMVEAFSKRALIGTAVTMGYVLLAALLLLIGFITARRTGRAGLPAGALAGLIVGGALLLLAASIPPLNLRSIFVSATPRLVQILAPGGPADGWYLPLAGGAMVGLLGAGLTLLPSLWQRALVIAAVATMLVGLMREVLVPILPRDLGRFLFTTTGLQPAGALIIFLLAGVIVWATSLIRTPAPAASPRAGTINPWSAVQFGVAGLLLLTFPLWSGLFLSNVADFVGLYIVMGLGLNLVVGFAGMLDLGYVGFFAIGAYAMAVLTSNDIGIAGLNFWTALPLAVLVATLAGIMLGLPVLKMRGDYLAITTLGFGEIIRLLALSDWLRPYLGGAQGITRIARPQIGTFVADTPQEFYYLILIACGIAWFVAARLKHSRLGRAWMAIREDEDVAQAMGINRTTAKLTAFALGALLGGMSGAIFGSMVNSVVPNSFGLLVSINVVALIIIGGMGSLPGVVIGALVLVGLPELLREFSDYRLLIYGALLVVMMLYRPQGLWPEAAIAREMHDAEALPAPEEVPAVMPAVAPPRKTEG